MAMTYFLRNNQSQYCTRSRVETGLFIVRFARCSTFPSICSTVPRLEYSANTEIALMQRYMIYPSAAPTIRYNNTKGRFSLFRYQSWVQQTGLYLKKSYAIPSGGCVFDLGRFFSPAVGDCIT